MLRVTTVDRVDPAPYTVLGWLVGDLDAALHRLDERGVEPVRYDAMEQDAGGIWTSPSGSRIAWFRDPDGNTLSLTQRS
jgi:predicted enzyme related to lactoylglutathione lyase